ncbi:hypothetical protein K503DRAFT_798985 [Rhizopogon vinicolor AM-OR11-026]|uniref:Uncharacterized protein n=1 Tax=Rhizopogon vinicolor AM-OR11-026 TaxID=1314800 RepID=A0A1B7N5S2_9AGAM|nr:hypothetical protein K503DRAFT_798985 [Rhizopogon vinicolor AM-OR11-026]
MRPAPSTPTSGTQSSGGTTTVDDSGDMIPRPTATDFRRLVSGTQENIIHVMDITPAAFERFKKVLRDRAHVLLDCERFLYEQNPDAWAAYLDWARGELAPTMSRYVDAWPVELYVEHYLSKRTYYKRHDFRKKMRFKYPPKPVRIKTPPSEHDASLPAPTGPPPPYEDHDFEYPGAIARRDDKVVENFLQTVNPDLGHLVSAFEELGINNEADLIVVRLWPPAVRKDFFERELVGKMSALQIQALNVRLGEL